MIAEYNKIEGVLDLYITKNERADLMEGMTIRTPNNLPEMGYIFLRGSDNVDPQEEPRTLTGIRDIQIRLPSDVNDYDGNGVLSEARLNFWDGKKIPFTAEELQGRYKGLKHFAMHFVPDRLPRRADSL